MEPTIRRGKHHRPSIVRIFCRTFSRGKPSVGHQSNDGKAHEQSRVVADAEQDRDNDTGVS